MSPCEDVEVKNSVATAPFNRKLRTARSNPLLSVAVSDVILGYREFHLFSSALIIGR